MLDKIQAVLMRKEFKILIMHVAFIIMKWELSNPCNIQSEYRPDGPIVNNSADIFSITVKVDPLGSLQKKSSRRNKKEFYSIPIKIRYHRYESL